jgi:1,2-diacylglycerol 3-beta-glucosyltransferase
MVEGKKILVVEDELITATDMRFTLEDMNYEVVGTAATGKEAIDLCREKHPDLVLMDHNLKGDMNGVESAQYVLDLGSKVVFLTGEDDEDSLRQFKEVGASGYILKPYNVNLLKETVEGIIGPATPKEVKEESPKDIVSEVVPEEGTSDEVNVDKEYNGTKYILVVEDEMITALDIKLKLQDYGYNVITTVKSGEDAIDVLSENHADLVLMDILLQGELNGIETTRILKSKYEDICIIYLTANTNKDIADQAKTTNPNGYLSKPFDEVELFTVIDKVLREKDGL